MNCEKWATSCLLLLLLLIFGVTGCDNKPTEKEKEKRENGQSVKADPLPSWNNGPLKESIIAYVKSVSDTASYSYIPVVDRIATFDNDGTLWAEKPYVQDRRNVLSANTGGWKE